MLRALALVAAVIGLLAPPFASASADEPPLWTAYVTPGRIDVGFPARVLRGGETLETMAAVVSRIDIESDDPRFCFILRGATANTVFSEQDMNDKSFGTEAALRFLGFPEDLLKLYILSSPDRFIDCAMYPEGDTLDRSITLSTSFYRKLKIDPAWSSDPEAVRTMLREENDRLTLIRDSVNERGRTYVIPTP